MRLISSVNVSYVPSRFRLTAPPSCPNRRENLDISLSPGGFKLPSELCSTKKKKLSGRRVSFNYRRSFRFLPFKYFFTLYDGFSNSKAISTSLPRTRKPREMCILLLLLYYRKCSHYPDVIEINSSSLRVCICAQLQNIGIERRKKKGRKTIRSLFAYCT